MSVRATTWAWDSSAEGTDLLVLLALADWASVHDDDTDERCWPSVAKVAGRCKISTRTAQRSIKILEGAGSVMVGPHPNWQGAANRRPNAYTILDPRGVILSPQADRGDNGGSGGVTSGVESADDTLSVEPKENPGSDGPDWDTELPPPVAAILGIIYPEPFEKTWVRYPSARRKAKRGTYKAWRATVVRLVNSHDGTPRECMMMLYRATVGYAADMTRKVENGSAWDFVKLSETFYGPGEPWRDYLGHPSERMPPERKEWEA